MGQIALEDLRHASSVLRAGLGDGSVGSGKRPDELANHNCSTKFEVARATFASRAASAQA